MTERTFVERTTPSIKVRRPTFNKTELPRFLGRRILWSLGYKRPHFAYLKITRRCNLDCYYCPWHTAVDDFSEELPTDQWLKIIDSLADRGVRVMVFEGGEPTLRRDLPELLDRASTRGVVSALATNGHGDIWRFQPRFFTVSLDGPGPVHDKVRGRGSYSSIRRNLARRQGQTVMCVTVLTHDNYIHIEDLVEDLSSLVDGFLFTFVYPYKGLDTKPVPPVIVSETQEKLRLLSERYPIVAPPAWRAPKDAATSCKDLTTVAVNHRGEIRDRCFVEHVEERNCKDCNLGCYQLLSSLHEFNLEAWFSFYRVLLRKI